MSRHNAKKMTPTSKLYQSCMSTLKHKLDACRAAVITGFDGTIEEEDRLSTHLGRWLELNDVHILPNSDEDATWTASLSRPSHDEYLILADGQFRKEWKDPLAPHDRFSSRLHCQVAATLARHDLNKEPDA